MANDMEADSDLDIAALRKKVAVRHVNLMEPGPGTPWEDRGSAGAVGAFVRTAVAAMSKPKRLLRSIRRTDTHGDARLLAIVYGVFWGIAWVINDAIAFGRSNEPFDFYSHGYAMIIHFAMAVAGTWLLVRGVSGMCGKLISQGTGASKAPEVLVFNVLTYCLGPSVLAVVPFLIGPGVALVWIVGLWITGSVSRLGLKAGNALVCVLMSTVVIVGGSVGAYHLIVLILRKLDVLG